MPDTSLLRRRQQARREQLQRYVHLQRELVEGDPSSPRYHGTIHAFRQMGHALIAAGFEDDLDRLLRIRILDGGRPAPATRPERSQWPDLTLIESVPVSEA